MMIQGLYIANAGPKGRGVYTKRKIAAHTVVEVSPVVVLNCSDRVVVENTILYYYIFEWGQNSDEGALGLGYVSLYNHESPSNCEYTMDYEAATITIQSMRDIMAGEELTINYSAGWDDWQPVWFDEAK
jgi:SET domain-containing protein